MNKTLASINRIAWAALLAFAVAGAPAAAAVRYDGLKNVNAFAGSGQYGESAGASGAASFRSPRGIKLLADGTLLVADTDSHLIRRAKNGQIGTLAGVTFRFDAAGKPVGGLADGTADASVFQSPSDVDVDAAGNVYVADTGNHAIRKIDPEGRVTTLAGSPIGAAGWKDGRGGEARFYAPSALAVAPDGTVYVADTLNHAIRKVTPDGDVTTLNAFRLRGVEVFPGAVEPAGDYRDGKLSEALFNEPSGIALDDRGNLYVSDSGNQRIRYIDLAAGTVTTVAGGGDLGANDFYVAGDYADGDAREARFDSPKGLAYTPQGLLIADSGNHAVRLLRDGTVYTVAGSARAEAGKVNGPEKSARFMFPTDVDADGRGTIYVADAYNNQIRVIADYRFPEGAASDGNIRVAVGERLVAFDVQPAMRNARVLVSVRPIAEALGYAVRPEGNDTVVLERGDIRVVLRIGETRATVAGPSGTAELQLDAAPYVENGRTQVPVRFISEALGKQVDWIADRQLAVIR